MDAIIFWFLLLRNNSGATIFCLLLLRNNGLPQIIFFVTSQQWVATLVPPLAVNARIFVASQQFAS
jgi:hypothetical protein